MKLYGPSLGRLARRPQGTAGGGAGSVDNGHQRNIRLVSPIKVISGLLNPVS